MIGEGMEAAPGSADGAGLNDAFIIVYRVVAILGIIGFVVITLLALMDVVLYYFSEIQQRFKLTLDPNMANKDTTDVDVLRYLANDIDNEPYNVFLQQNLVKGLYTVIGLVVIVFGIQISSFFVLKIVSIVKEMPFKEKIDLPVMNIGIIVIVFAGITMMNYLYKHVFLKDTQPSLKGLRSQLREIKSYIYANADFDRAQNRFFPAMLANDMDTVIEALQAKIKETTRPDAKTLQSSDYTAARMIFALNLYTYFHYEIPEGDPASDEIRKMFSADGLRTQKVDPAMYFYYKKPIYITNMYPSLRKDLKQALGARERAFVQHVAIMMRDLNRRLARLQLISSGKKKIDDYLWRILFVSLFISAALLIVYLQKFELIIIAWVGIKSLVGKFASVFTKKS
jgi:hypothetical protein